MGPKAKNRPAKRGCLLSALVLSVLFICHGTSRAEHLDRFCDIEGPLPKSARDAREFVPAGWTIRHRVSGPIFPGRQEDTALMIQSKPKDKGQQERAALVILKKTGQDYQRHTVSCEVLAVGGMMLYGSTIMLKEGILVIESSYGSRSLYKTRLRFRYEASKDRFRLIGRDHDVTDRLAPQGPESLSRRETINYLTGEKVVNGTKTRVPQTAIYLDEIDYSGERSE